LHSPFSSRLHNRPQIFLCESDEFSEFTVERAGIPRKVAMAISGHKTESIYRRYDIVAHRDLADAGTRMEQYFSAAKQEMQEQKEQKEQMGTLLGTPDVAHPPEKQGARSKRAGKPLK
jgi:hypothetical protein